MGGCWLEAQNCKKGDSILIETLLQDRGVRCWDEWAVSKVLEGFRKPFLRPACSLAETWESCKSIKTSLEKSTGMWSKIIQLLAFWKSSRQDLNQSYLKNWCGGTWRGYSWLVSLKKVFTVESHYCRIPLSFVKPVLFSSQQWFGNKRWRMRQQKQQMVQNSSGQSNLKVTGRDCMRTKARVTPRWVKWACTGECGCKYTGRVRSVKLIVVLQWEHLKSLWMCFW